MSIKEAPEVSLSAISDPQRPVAFAAGLWLIVVGVAGITGIIDTNIGYGPGLVFGVFAVPLWLDVTAIVAGILGIGLSMYEGAGTTFNKLAGALVVPIVILLTLADWAIASGGALLIVAVVAFLLAGIGVVVGTILLFKRPVSIVLPVVAVLALADWTLGLSGMLSTTEPANLATVVFLIAHAILLTFIGFEGGSRLT